VIKRPRRSRALRACWVALAILIAGCAGSSTRDVPATYTVKPGDTVYAIAWRHNMDYRVLARWNNLPADYRIEPGQVLRLRPPAGSSAGARTPPPGRVPTPPPRPSPPIDRSIAAWTWPAEGASTIARHSPTESQGLLIMGAEGAPVRAAAAGRVVYTGSGLRGFGNLVIIKHSNVFLSAYGHNRDLKVKEGDDVTLGQIIASMGFGPGQKPALYFEIRYNGQPVDPLAYLPARPGS
jgi:lipoprotein NlpD